MRNAFFHAFFFTFLNQIIWQKNDWFASSLEEICFSWLTLKHCNEWISLQSSITQKVIITRSTVFHHPQGMRGCHNNGDIMAGCHYEVSTWQGVPTNCSECLPQLDIRDTDRREGNGKTPRVGKRGEREEDREKKVRGGIWRGRKGGGDKWEERRWRVAGWKSKMRRKRDWRGRVQWLEYDGLCRPCRTRLCVYVCMCECTWRFWINENLRWEERVIMTCMQMTPNTHVKTSTHMCTHTDAPTVSSPHNTFPNADNTHKEMHEAIQERNILSVFLT